MSIGPLCRTHVAALISGGGSKCSKGRKCRFNHPATLTPDVLMEYERESGHCYCGAALRTLRNTRALPDDEGSERTERTERTERKPFFVVCGRTDKNIAYCRGKRRRQSMRDQSEEIILGPIPAAKEPGT